MRTRDSGVLALKVRSKRAKLVAKSELSLDRPMEKWKSSSFARPSSLASCVGQDILARRLRAGQATEAWRLSASRCERPSKVQAPHCFIRVLHWSSMLGVLPKRHAQAQAFGAWTAKARSNCHRKGLLIRLQFKCLSALWNRVVRRP